MNPYYEEQYERKEEEFEFNGIVNELLNKEVEKRVGEKIKGYEYNMEQAEKHRVEISERRSEVRELQADLLVAEKKFAKQGEDNVMRKLLGGYKLGDKVWYLRSKSNQVECGTCAGGKEVEANVNGEMRQVKCPDCNYGYHSVKEYSVASGTFSEMKVHTWAEGRKLEVNLYVQPEGNRNADSVKFWNYDDLYATEEECVVALEVKRGESE